MTFQGGDGSKGIQRVRKSGRAGFYIGTHCGKQYGIEQRLNTRPPTTEPLQEFKSAVSVFKSKYYKVVSTEKKCRILFFLFYSRHCKNEHEEKSTYDMEAELNGVQERARIFSQRI